MYIDSPLGNQKYFWKYKLGILTIKCLITYPYPDYSYCYACHLILLLLLLSDKSYYFHQKNLSDHLTVIDILRSESQNLYNFPQY